MLPAQPWALQPPPCPSALTTTPFLSLPGLLLLASWVWGLWCECHGQLSNSELRSTSSGPGADQGSLSPSLTSISRPLLSWLRDGCRVPQGEPRALGKGYSPYPLPPGPTLKFPSCTLVMLW